MLLYELLTGSTPLRRERLRDATYAEILRVIKEEEPPRPSTRLSSSCEAGASISARPQMEPLRLAKLVRGELDWIVMKSLEKDRNRRCLAEARRWIDEANARRVKTDLRGDDDPTGTQPAWGPWHEPVVIPRLFHEAEELMKTKLAVGHRESVRSEQRPPRLAPQ